MKILLSHKNGRNRLTCVREDGTWTSADLGPSLPTHDLAHLVVERRLSLTSGFFIFIAKGHSIQELSEAATLRGLGAEPYVAEILARGVGCLLTGACTPEQLPELVGMELAQMGLLMPAGVSAESAREMLAELKDLLERFQALAPGESLHLQLQA